ncbi:MAG: sigma factor [Hyphomonadaceae bacterium]
MPAPRAFADLRALARRASRRPDEADDLLQTALLAALESGRNDLAAPEARRWLSGVIRKRATFDARSAARAAVAKPAGMRLNPTPRPMPRGLP